MTPEALETLARKIPYLSDCGNPKIPSLAGFSLHALPTVEAAKKEFYSTGRDYLKVEAQGDLTGWLAKNAAKDYGGVWNKKAKEYGERISPITDSIRLPTWVEGDFGTDLRSYLRSLVVLYGMESFYAAYTKRPKFFISLIEILEAGRFPCGCVTPWPSKELYVF